MHVRLHCMCVGLSLDLPLCFKEFISFPLIDDTHIHFLSLSLSLPLSLSPFISLHPSLSLSFLAQSETGDPIRSFLEYTLPNDESTSLNPGLVATVTLSHLDRLASPYYALQTVGTGCYVGVMYHTQLMQTNYIYHCVLYIMY